VQLGMFTGVLLFVSAVIIRTDRDRPRQMAEG
jgi:hypothetical protein